MLDVQVIVDVLQGAGTLVCFAYLAYGAWLSFLGALSSMEEPFGASPILGDRV